MSEHEEEIWIRGNRAAWTRMLQHVLGELGIGDAEAGKARWILEREAVVAALREICDEYGDNDWEPDLHLGDVLEKHLFNYLESTARKRRKSK